MPKTVPTKPYDWTYTTTYPGHISIQSPDTNSWRTADPQNASHAIPFAELTRPDPILFYAEIPLFEDELHDNGSSNVLVRIVSAYMRRSAHAFLTRCIAIASNADLHVRSVAVHIARR